MKCWFCPCRVENSNEIDGYQPDGCFMVMITLMIIAMKIKTVIVVAIKQKKKLKMT